MPPSGSAGSSSRASTPTRRQSIENPHNKETTTTTRQETHVINDNRFIFNHLNKKQHEGNDSIKPNNSSNSGERFGDLFNPPEGQPKLNNADQSQYNQNSNDS